MIKIKWLGHACFKVTQDDFSVIFDPYRDGSVPGLRPLRETADLVLCSHEHDDHNARSNVKIRTGHDNPFTVSWLDTYHDEAGGTKRGPDRIHILTTDVAKIVHLGDLGCPLTKEQLMRLDHPDVLMIPVGGYFTIDAEQAKAIQTALKPRITIPMHYRTADYGYSVIGGLDAFTQLCDDVIRYPDAELIVTPAVPEQTAVLTYRG